MNELAAWGILAGVVVGVALLLWGISELYQRYEGRRYGRLEYVDTPATSERLVSERYRLVGRPDEVRRRPDGRPVPVEWKSRPSPRDGPPRSHRLQVGAYCLLLEDLTGFSPPYGVLRYGDGSEQLVVWDERARDEVLRVREALLRPYDGRADPSPGKCAGCRWRPGCDARA
jgi:CRISPR-associated exonuclease Cas4